MRTELETQLLFCAPREVLLVGDDMSGRSRKLLAGFAGPASQVRLETVPKTHAPDTAAAALHSFFEGSGAHSHGLVGFRRCFAATKRTTTPI